MLTISTKVRIRKQGFKNAVLTNYLFNRRFNSRKPYFRF